MINDKTLIPNHKCNFVGYEEQYGIKGYHLYDQTSCRFFMSMNDIFDENVLFPIQFVKKLQTPTIITCSCVWCFVRMAFAHTTSICSSCFPSKPNCFTHLANTTHTSNTASIHGTFSSSSYLTPFNDTFWPPWWSIWPNYPFHSKSF